MPGHSGRGSGFSVGGGVVGAGVVTGGGGGGMRSLLGGAGRWGGGSFLSKMPLLVMMLRMGIRLLAV